MACQCSKRFYYFCFFLSVFITSQKVHQACSWSNHLGQFIEIKWHSRHWVLLLRVPINPSSGRDASSQASSVLGCKICFSLISSCFSPPTCHCNYKPSTRQPALQSCSHVREQLPKPQSLSDVYRQLFPTVSLFQQVLQHRWNWHTAIAK